MINNRRQLYWLLQTVGWSGYMFFVMLSAFVWDKVGTTHMLYAIFAASIGLLLSMAMRESYLLLWDTPSVKRSLLTILSVILTNGIWAFGKMYVYFKLYPGKETENLLGEYISWYTYSFFILLSWTGLYYGIRFYQEMQAVHRIQAAMNCLIASE